MRFDTVVVGIGSAGSLLVERLSADPSRSVLAIEAGPVFAADSLPDSVRKLGRPLDQTHNWGDEAQSVAGMVLPYTRGKLAGGCSAINATMALRCVDGDTPMNLGPHFDTVERELALERYAEDELAPIQAAFAERCRDLGYAWEPNHNDPATTGGVGPVPMNRRGTTRVSAADAWLYPSLQRPNLTVWGDTEVERVVIEGGRATGVIARGERIEAGAVILSTGVVQTPRLLWRSGLDDPSIGTNLTDHPSVPLRFTYREADDERRPPVQVILRAPSLVTDRPFDLWMAIFTGMAVPGMQAVERLPTIFVSPQTVPPTGRVTPTGIEWPYLEDATVMAELRAGLALARELATDGALGKLVEPLPVVLDDAYIVEHHRAFLHGCGTCTGVVDDDLQVLPGLRICDTSVLPVVPRANPNLTVLALADWLAAKIN